MCFCDGQNANSNANERLSSLKTVLKPVKFYEQR